MCDPIMFPEIHCPDQEGWPCPDDDQNAVANGTTALSKWEDLGAQWWNPRSYPSTLGQFVVELDQSNDRIKWDGSWVDVSITESKAECSATDSSGRKWKVQHSETHGGFLAGSTCQIAYYDGGEAHSRLLG
jgi:hypothetical protein